MILKIPCFPKHFSKTSLLTLYFTAFLALLIKSSLTDIHCKHSFLSLLILNCHNLRYFYPARYSGSPFDAFLPQIWLRLKCKSPPAKTFNTNSHLHSIGRKPCRDYAQYYESHKINFALISNGIVSYYSGTFS